MALFKEIHCAHCGKKTNLLMRTHLADDQYVCSQCTAKIPSYIKSCLGAYTFEGFVQLKQYLAESKTTLGQVFRETHCYKTIHLDAEHGIFYVDDYQQRLYLPLSELQDFELQFVAEEAKEGLLLDKVVGEVHLSMQVAFPYFCRSEVIAHKVKASADVKQGLFKKTFVYNQPKGMPEFLQAFKSAWAAAKEEKYMQQAMEQVQQQTMYGNGF